MKKNLLIILVLTILLGANNVFGQDYVTKLRTNNHVSGGIQFANDLAAFLEMAERLESKKVVINPEIQALEALGQKVINGASKFRSNLKGLVSKIKGDNRWDDNFDRESLTLLGNRKIKSLFQSQGARKILSEADLDLNDLAAEIKGIIGDLRRRVGDNQGENRNFRTVSFSERVALGKFRCFLLGAAIFFAEIIKAPKTAENLDQRFDSKCGGKGGKNAPAPVT
jgi:hypothetical protein